MKAHEGETQVIRLLSFNDLRQQKNWPYSKVHTWRLIKAGKFPHPKKLGLGKNGKNIWIEDEYDAAVAALLGDSHSVVAERTDAPEAAMPGKAKPGALATATGSNGD
jgi:predicted DNA-binding transcriptional regulator AlpA